MRKTFIALSLFMLALLAACKKPQPEPVDVSYTFSGLTEVNMLIGDTLDLMEGVKVIGSDEVDYTDSVSVLLNSSSVTKEGNTITAIAAGDLLVRYRLTIKGEDGAETVAQEEHRKIIITSPPKPEGEMISNGDFSEGLAYWETYSGAGAMTTEFEDNALKITLTAVGQAYEPRVTQMGVPFEKGKAYKVSYRAKALANKTIHLQVGEILANDPWFTDFKPGQKEVEVITTEWAEYSYEFIMTLDNDRGGVLFEFGTVDGDDTKTTIWLTDVKVEEVAVSADTEAPVITVKDIEILKDSTINLSTYIYVFDKRDGEIAFADLDIEIKKGEEVVQEIDTSKEAEYVVSVTATDKAGNTATETFTVTVVSMDFKEENLVVNGDFKAPIGETPEWATWVPDWDKISEVAIDIVNEELEIEVIQSGSEGWHIQLFQEGLFELQEGKTYRFMFDIKGVVGQKVLFEVIDGVDSTNPVKYLASETILTDEMQTVEMVFTVTKPVALSKFLFMFGGLEVGKYYIDNVVINEAVVQPLIVNSKFEALDGWVADHAGAGEGAITLTKEDVGAKVTTTLVGDEPYQPHLLQEFTINEAGTYNFKMIVNSNVARTLRINFTVPAEGYWSLLEGGSYDIIITEEEVGKDILVEISFTVAAAIGNPVKFEVDFGKVAEGDLVGEFLLKEVLLYKLY